MAHITELEKHVRALEEATQGGLLPDAGRAAALTLLIIATEYADSEERYTAQRLVILLDRLRCGARHGLPLTPGGVAPSPASSAGLI